MNTAVMFSEQAKPDSKSWATPRHVVEQIGRRIGKTPGLDAAATKHSRVCDLYYGPDHDSKWFRNSLADALPWVTGHHEFVWLNPPYGRGLGEWLRKAYLVGMESTYADVLVLVPARTDTKWFHEYVLTAADTVYFVEGRLKFCDPVTLEQYKDAAPFPSMIVRYRVGGEQTNFTSIKFKE